MKSNKRRRRKLVVYEVSLTNPDVLAITFRVTHRLHPYLTHALGKFPTRGRGIFPEEDRQVRDLGI